MSRIGSCETLVSDCRLRAVTDLFTHTWDPVVLAALREGPRRRRTLHSAIGGISDKVLSQSLQRLAVSGLIERHGYAETPPRVDYALTPLGASLVDGPLASLGTWIEQHGDELLAAQETSLGNDT